MTVGMTGMATLIDPYSLTSGDVARVLGVTDEQVRRLDDLLQPRRRPNGRRYYHPRIVAAVARRRERVRGLR
jgi:DNA-binding transcriptional MerR regulator